MISTILTFHTTAAIGYFVGLRAKAAFDRGMNYTPNSIWEDLLLSVIWEIPLGLALKDMLKRKLRHRS